MLKQLWNRYKTTYHFKTIIVALFIVVTFGCQPLTEYFFDELSGSLSGGAGVRLDSVKVLSHPYGTNSEFDLTPYFEVVYDSASPDVDGRFSMPEGFPTIATLESSLGCSYNQKAEIKSISNETFVLSFVWGRTDTFSVLIIDTTGYGDRIEFEIDSTTIDSVIMGDEDLLGKPGSKRVIPEIVLIGSL